MKISDLKYGFWLHITQSRENKMGYSIFEKTMADMTWQEVEKASKENQIVLFPLGVIEEHGPHLPLGTDSYWSYASCKLY